MEEKRIILNANVDRRNVVLFEDFIEIFITTLQTIREEVMPLCGKDAVHALVIYENLGNDYMQNVFSNDGIHILKNTEYMNPIQTYITNCIRYIAERVERAAADGTSTAIYLATSLLIDTLYDVRSVYSTENENYAEDENLPISVIYSSMRVVNKQAADVVTVLNELQRFIEKIVVRFNDINDNFKRKLIYHLAYTTSKGNTKLTEYTVDLFHHLPELLYEHTLYRRSKIETEEAFIVEHPEHDMSVAVSPSHNIQYNEKLGTELVYEQCDLLVIPNLYGRVHHVKSFITDRKELIAAGEQLKPLVIVYCGGDDSDHIVLEREVDFTTMALCKYLAYEPVFANNPLELKIVQVMGGLEPTIPDSINDVEQCVLHNVKCRIYDNCLFIYNLFDHAHLPFHPSYVTKDHAAYNKICLELEKQITYLKTTHTTKNTTSEMNAFIRMYRNLVCSKLPMLTIGGSTVEHLSNYNVVQDVLGVVSVSLKHGVIIDMMPKIAKFFSDFMEMQDVDDWVRDFYNDILNYVELTYRGNTVIDGLFPSETNTFLSESLRHIKYLVFDQEKETWVLNDMENTWVLDDKEEIDSANGTLVVQSYKAIQETIHRLIETVPKFIKTDRIIVPGGVMGVQGE